MTPEEKVYRCWESGVGIKETMLAVRRITGARLTFEEVRQQFTTLSWRFA